MVDFTSTNTGTQIDTSVDNVELLVGAGLSGVNIDSGNIDGTIIGSSVPTTGQFTIVTLTTTSGETALNIDNTAAGDSVTNYKIGGVLKAVVGVDNSDADKFKMAIAALATPFLEVNSSSEITIPNLFTVGADVIVSGGKAVLTETSIGQALDVINSNVAPGSFAASIQYTGASPDDNTAKFLLCKDTTTDRLFIFSDGDLANHDGVYGTISDRKLKTDWQIVRSYWEDFKLLGYQTYLMLSDIAQYSDEAKRRMGLIVDEVEKIFPGLVMYAPDMETIEIEPAVEEKIGQRQKTVERPALDANGEPVLEIVSVTIPETINDNGELILEHDEDVEQSKTETVGVTLGGQPVTEDYIVTEAKAAVTEEQQIIIDGVPQQTGMVKSSIIDGVINSVVLQEAQARIEELETRLETAGIL